MVVGQSGAPLITVLASVEEVFNTGRENVTIQSKFVSNIASKPMLSNLVDVSMRHNSMMHFRDVNKVNSF